MDSPPAKGFVYLENRITGVKYAIMIRPSSHSHKQWGRLHENHAGVKFPRHRLAAGRLTLPNQSGHRETTG